MKLKHAILRMLSCGAILFAAMVQGNAANGIIEWKEYRICPGDTLKMDTRKTVVHSDTILYDTIHVADPTKDSIYAYIVNLYPSFYLKEEREIELGTSFEWHGETITRAGTYEHVYKTVHGCDSTYIVTVTERTKKEKEVTFSLCDGETIQFHNKTYSEAGIYYDSYTSDSIYKIHIIKYPSVVYLTEATFDGINPYIWRVGKMLKDSIVEAAGVYEYAELNTETGCNDLYRLVLTMDPNSFHFTESATICEGDEYEWHGLSHLSRQGIGETTHYFDRYRTSSNQDSIYELILTVLPVARVSHTVPFCESITWNGVTYTESTVVIDTLHSLYSSCDSIITTHLSKGISLYMHDTATIALGEALEWHGQTITHAGLYEDKHRSAFGCDSIYTIGVGMKDAAAHAKIRKYHELICEGSEYVWRGKTYWRDGLYIDTTYLPGTQTIDSLYVLELSLKPSYSQTEHVTFPFFPVSYRGMDITQPGTYTFDYHSSLNCDSTITAIIDLEVVRDIQTVTICPGETYQWRGHKYHESYQYKEVEKDIHGNDSVEHILNLTVRYIPETYVSQTICQGNSVTFGDKTLTKSGVYRHTFKQNGCDSTVVLSLNVINPDTVRYVHNMAEGETFTWHDSTYTETGVDYYSTTNRFGCDSIEILILTVNHVDTIDTTATICPNESITWHGITARQTGTFTGMETQPDGSIHYYRLHLTLREMKHIQESFVICSDETVRYNGKTYTKAGYYYDQLGCDTTVEIHITQYPQQVYETRARLENDQPYSWTYMDKGTEQTKTFDQPGTYQFLSPNPETTCNDIWRLILTQDESEYHFVEEFTICEGDDFSWHGLSNLSRQLGLSRYYDRYSTANGKDSIYELVLTVLPAVRSVRSMTFCGSTTWRGVTYTESTVVYDTLVSVQYGCDSIVRINLDKVPSFYQHDTATIIQGEILNWHGLNISTDGLYRDAHTNMYGCDSIYEIGVGLIAATPQSNLITTIWSMCEGDVYRWRDKDYTVGGTYVDTVWDEGREQVQAIYALNLTVWPSNLDTIIQHLYECNIGASIRYNGKDYYQNDTLTTTFRTIHNCDSIVRTILHFGEALRMSDTIEIADAQLPYTWKYKLKDAEKQDSVLTAAGTYSHTVPAEGGCVNYEEIILIVHPTYLFEDSIDVCSFNLPFKWTNGPAEHADEGLSHTIGTTKTYEYRYSSIHNTDSIYRLHLTIFQSPDTTVYIHGCSNKGAYWRDKFYMNDTAFIDRIPTLSSPEGNLCDSIYHVNIVIDTAYFIRLDTTLCEYQLPLVVGTINPDTIWDERDFRHDTDTTYCGCDSIIEGHLTIIPKLTKNDSTFLCEGDFVTLGDTVHPAFMDHDGSRWAGKWEGKWKGINYTEDTIVWDCDHRYFHHVIVRPKQTVIKDTTLFLCPDDSLQLFWGKGDDTTWFYKDTLYEQHIPMSPYWTDEVHGNHYANDQYTCDSVVRWHIKKLPRYHDETTVHKLLGDSIFWGGKWRYYTGIYDSIIASPDTSSLGDTCMYIHPLHLIIDTAYYFRDTVEMCAEANKTYAHVWRETGHTQYFTVGAKDSLSHHFKDSLITYDRRDSIYDLCVNYRIIQHTLIFDTICEDSRYRFDSIHGTVERWLEKPGRYTDTLTAVNGCDSIVTLQLYVRNRVPVNHITVHIPDTLIPYAWKHHWYEHGVAKDSTHWLSATGDYAFRMPSIYGCDSIDSISLFVHKTYRIKEDTIILCNDQTPYTWQDRNDITKTGDYTFHALTKEGYDSIRYVHIKVLPVLRSVILDTLCYGDSMQFGLTKAHTTRFLHKTGVYYDTLTSVQHGCDSIIELRLNVFDKYFNEQTRHISVADTPFVWEHKQGGLVIEKETLHLSGGQTQGYTYTFTSSFGCDSIDSLTLHVHQTYLYRDTVRICQNETPYEWEGIKDIYTTDEYIKHLRTHDGYDSIRVRYVEVLPVPRKLIVDTICEGDSLRFGLTSSNKVRFVSKNGIYYDTLTSVRYGCDSIIELRLNVYPKYRNHQKVHVADKELPYVWKHIQGGVGIEKEDLFATGEYVYHFTTAFGCDSIDSLSLVVHNTYLFTEDITICERETPYTWQDRNDITKSGTYKYDARTHDGYDSIYIANITVTPTQRAIIHEEICESNLPFYFHGTPLFKGGIYKDTTTSDLGCDSITELHLTVNHPYYHYERQDIYEGQSYMFFGKELKENNTYKHEAKTPAGCDSITELMLVVHPLIDTVATVCVHDLPFAWVNHWSGKTTLLHTAGIYHDDTTYVNGERTFWSIQLNVSQPTYNTIYREICEGDHYNFGGKQYKEKGEYRDTLINAAGCDSVIVLNLNVLKKYHNIVSRSIYEGDSVEFMGKYYKESGLYPITIPSSYGCDSIIELNLTVNRLYDDSVSVCANELPLHWRNREIYESGVFRDTTYADGQQVVTGLKVTVLPIARTPDPIIVKICEGDHYKFGDSILTEQGTYYDTLTAVNGCDSIVMLSLQVIPVKYQTEYRRIFEGDSVFFDGAWRKESGVYERRETNANNCTDTYQLVLTVLKTFNIDTTAVICINELPFIWRGYEYNESGDYTLPIAWTDSSRVVKTLHLQVNDTYYGERNVALCQGSTFIYKGKEYFESGSFYDTIPALSGCDSIIKYIVSVQPTYDRIDTVHISDKQTYTFYGRVLNQSGFYEHTQMTRFGCDSVHHLFLIVHPSYFFTDTVDLCKPDSLEWHGQVIKQSGVYTDSLLTVKFGFDSVYQVVVSVHPSFYQYEQYEIAEDQHLKIHGNDISEPGVYEDTLRTIYGCDSIFHIVVNPKRTVELEIIDSICQGDYYEFFGKKLYNPGKYINVDKEKAVITTLHLIVNPISIRDTVVTIPVTQSSYIYNGKLYTDLTEGKHLFTETYRNRYNCDSIVRIVINVTRRYSEWYPIPLCPGSEIKIDNKVITESGLYMFVRRSRETGEMDSLYRVEVYDAPAYEFAVEHTICDGDTVFYGDKPFTREGKYDITLKTTEGCDSVYHLNLHVNPTYNFYEYVSTPDYLPYEWYGKTYIESGVYDRSWSTINDCDSSYTLDLHVVETLRDTMTETICTGQSFNWRDKQLSVDGYYTDTVWQPEAPFSAIYALRLIVAYPTIITKANTGEVCADAESFDITFEYSGQKPTHYSVYFDQLAKREGFVDIINAPLGSDMIAHINLPQFSNVIYENHPYYVRPDYYSMRIALDNGVCGISRSDSLTLLVKYPSWIIEQNWDDVVAPLKAEYNGGYEFAQTEWRVNGEPQMNTSIGYLYNKELRVGDEVVMYAIRQGENYAIPTCPLVIQAMSGLAYDTPVIVYPAQAPKQMPTITIEAPYEGRYSIWTVTGRMLHSGNFDEGKTYVTLPSVSGMYFIRTTQGKDAETHKVILY